MTVKTIPNDRCKLCLKQDKLENSHIISSFVFRWLKETSGTGHFRSGGTINRRSQDGAKEYWLCPEHEDLFSRWETEFASRVFHPLTSGKASQFQYQEWLLKFACSLSWRVLLYLKETSGLSHFTEELRQEADRALGTWAEFLLGRRHEPGKYEQHLVVLGEIVEHTVQDMPANINRYLLRSVAIDAACSDREAYVYVKLPYILLIGFINIERPEEWEGTMVHAKQGVVGSSEWSLPRSVLEFIMGRARRASELQQNISARQQEAIRKSFMKNIDRLPETETFKATQADVALFGREAFTKARKS